MATPAERLCSRSWRLRNSLWMAPAILLMGIATWASFLYIGAKAKRRSWLIAAGLYGVATVATFVIAPAVSDGSKETSSGAETLGGMYMFVVWLGGIVHAAITNREWLRWKAHAEPVAWYAQGAGAAGGPTADERPADPTTSVDDVLLGATSGLTTPAVLAPPPPPPPPPGPPAAQASAAPPSPPPVASSAGAALVDLNAASVADLETRLGLTRTVAERVVAERARLGGFTAVEQLLTEVGIEPHIYARIRDTSAVGSPQGSAAARSRGRRLEL